MQRVRIEYKDGGRVRSIDVDVNDAAAEAKRLYAELCMHSDSALDRKVALGWFLAQVRQLFGRGDWEPWLQNAVGITHLQHAWSALSLARKLADAFGHTDLDKLAAAVNEYNRLSPDKPIKPRKDDLRSLSVRAAEIAVGLRKDSGQRKPVISAMAEVTRPATHVDFESLPELERYKNLGPLPTAPPGLQPEPEPDAEMFDEDEDGDGEEWEEGEGDGDQDEDGDEERGTEAPRQQGIKPEKAQPEPRPELIDRGQQAQQLTLAPFYEDAAAKFERFAAMVRGGTIARDRIERALAAVDEAERRAA